MSLTSTSAWQALTRHRDALCAQGMDTILRDAARLKNFDIAFDGPVADFAAETDAVARHIQTFKRTNSALAVTDASPELLHLATERGGDANPCDNDTAFHARQFRQAEDSSAFSAALLM